MDQKTINRGLDEIANIDKDIKHALYKIGYPQSRKTAAGFYTLVNTIVSQQLSAKAADKIMQRVCDTLGQVTPKRILTKHSNSLRKAGLSERKVSYIKGLAKAVHEGDFEPDALATMSDYDAIQSITKLHGFGEWSAEIYLLFSLGRTDIFPANDLALQIALTNLKKLDEKPKAKHARILVRHWIPWRSMGSLFLWHYYQKMKENR